MKPIIPALLAFPFLSGCIAWEIRDEMRRGNDQLCEANAAVVHSIHQMAEIDEDAQRTAARLSEVQVALTQTTAQLSDVQLALTQTTAQLARVEGALQGTDQHLALVDGSLGQMQPKMTDINGGLDRMAILSDVHATLKEMEKTLVPMSSTMGSVGGAMSFLGLGGDSTPDVLTEEERAAAAAASAKTGAAETGAPAAGHAGGVEADAADPNAPKRPDPLLGTWVLVYPPPAPASSGTGAQNSKRILVMMADGRFLVAENGGKPRTGHWSRMRRQMTMTYDLEPGAPAGAMPEVETGELLTLNSRTLTVRKGDTIRVHARP
jgi:hypothetical protein